MGYGFEWRYQGYHPSYDTLETYQPFVKFTTKITNTEFTRPDRHYGIATTDSGSELNPLTELMIHYGRPVITKASEFDDLFPGPIPVVTPHHYEQYTFPFHNIGPGMRSHTESIWSAQVKAAALQVCGYPEAVPGDFLIGLLPKDHWTKPKGIKKIGIRLGLDVNGYYRHQTINKQLFSVDADYPSIGDTPPNAAAPWYRAYSWPKFHNTTHGSRNLAQEWFRNNFTRGGNVTRQNESSFFVKFKYRVFLGEMEITAKPLAEQPWSVNEWGPSSRKELNVAIPPDWTYDKVDLSVELYFENNSARHNSANPTGEYYALCFGQNGLGQWIWPGIDVLYDLTHDVKTPQNVTVAGLTGLTEGRVLPLSGRLALRDQVEFSGRDAVYLNDSFGEPYRATFPGPDHSADVLTGYFPSGNNHLPEDLTVADNMDTGFYRHQVGPPCSHMNRTVVSTVQTFGHWKGVQQVFDERLAVTEPAPNGKGGALADNFVPFQPGLPSQQVTVTPAN